MSWIYAMYKGEECLSIGTCKEICSEMNIKKETFYYYRTKAYKKRKKTKNSRVIIKIGSDN